MKRSLLKPTIAIVMSAIVSPSMLKAEQDMDFNEVGKQVSILLQNAHFSQKKWDVDLSRQFLSSYLDDLDHGRMYFLKTDVDRFEKEYGTRLHEMLLQRTSLTAAEDIYQVFKERVQNRVQFVNHVLKQETLSFDKAESIERSRKDSKWAEGLEESDRLWRLSIKESILSETLRRESIAKLAKEQGKEDPLLKEKDPKEKVALRYERLLHSVIETDKEEVANFFLSAVSKSFDPHTEYMGYREISRFKDSMRNQLVGIGALLEGEEDGATKIKGIVVGGPADRGAQLKLNDRIVGVDTNNSGEVTDITFMKIDKVVDLIRGKENTEVRLKIEPAGATPGVTKFITIVRGKVEMKDEQAHAEMVVKKSLDGLLKKIGIITLPSFYMDFDNGTASCADDVERLIKRLMDEKIDGLILDLRRNGGGSLDEVRKMTGFFIPKGPVVQVKDTNGRLEVKDSDLDKPLYTGPLIVMIDKSSASASEILAGALQDHNRAIIVGDSSSFGKGTVQQLMDVGKMMPFFARRDRAGTVKVTLQKFYRPSGDSTQLKGVESDIVVPSMLDGLEVGEGFLDHVMPFDRIRAASDFKPMDRTQLFVDQLKKRSEERIHRSKDILYVMEDVAEAKKRISENRISLNKAERDAELLEADRKRKARNDERKTRYALIEKEDRETLTFYKITLDMIRENKPLVAHVPSSKDSEYMIKAKDETEDLDDTPLWPSNLDAVKREGLAIAEDLAQMVKQSVKMGSTDKAVSQ